MIRVSAGSRIHFGLIDPAGGSGRRYGGAGLMVEEPGLEVTACAAEGLEATGPLADRAVEFARAWAGGAKGTGRLEVVRAPPEHVGLGTGTQLGLAVGAALGALRGEWPDAVEIARRVGRGLRSAVGVHGFDHGGFIVEDGKGPGEDIAPLTASSPVPRSWRLVLVLPAGATGISGAREREAFRRLRPDDARSASLRRLLLAGALPALARRDLRGFGGALGEYGRRAGEFFRETQGGIYASRLAAEVVGCLERAGAAGAGQSSWGPAVWAIAGGEEEAGLLVRAVVRRFGFSPREVVVTRARKNGRRPPPV